METTRYLGFCQICEGEFCLHAVEKTLVHHGYKRPGDGAIHGDCYGVGHAPYEVSCELVKEWLEGIRNNLEASRVRLGKLQAGEVTVISVVSRTGYQNILVPRIAGVTEPYIWHRTVEGEIRNTESSIRMSEHEVTRCEKRIAEWKPMPIRETSREIMDAEKRAEQAARGLVRKAARDAKAEKAAALEAKRAALAASRAAILRGFADRFEYLAATPNENRLEARLLASKLRMKKYSWVGCMDALGCDPALVALGLARVTTTNGRDWTEYLF